ncbi:MAG: hypothetical protein JW929_15320 [Anaerolineales bacterium]|nr:hypothetical protein [Anaerolineales bacterium]
MRFPVVRNRLLLLHAAAAVVLFAVAGVSVWRLIRFSPDPIGAAALIGAAIGVCLLPPILYRFYFLLRAGYETTPAGALILRFGSRREVLPIEEIEEIRSGSKIPDTVRRAAPGWLDMWHGQVDIPDGEVMEWMATDRGRPLLLLVTKRRYLAVSPASSVEFARCITDLSAQGGLEKIEPESAKPKPVFAEILRDPPAVGLLGPSLAGGIALGAFLTAIQPGLPADQPFRFDASGIPTSLGDPGRLLLLPLAGGAIWLINAVLGWWAWRKGQRPPAYTFWAVSFMVTAALWAASLSLLSAK